MYRDDDGARADRANALIREIGELERRKVEQVATDRRLEAVRLELRAMQAMTDAPERTPGPLAHLCVFAISACATFAGYALLS